MSPSRTDVAVIGRGVAAAAALLALRGSSHTVCVVAPQRNTADRIGETLSPSATPILRELGIHDRFLKEGHRRAQTTFSSWGTDELIERHAILQPEGPGWHLDRTRFESFLWDCAAGVATVDIPASLVRATPTPGGWTLTCRDSQGIFARFVIDCSGRACAFARHFSAVHRDDSLLAACSFLNQVDGDVDPTPAMLIEARPDGWWYSALLPDQRLVVCVFTDRDLLPEGIARDFEAWQNWVEQTTWTVRRIRSAGFALAGAPSCLSAATVWLDSTAGGDWAAAGDAAAAFDPLSSHGLTTALWSGREAARAAAARLDGDAAPLRRYAETMKAGVAGFLEQRRRVYGLERRFRDEPFWQRRQAPE